jgi:hypothetical protein
MASTTPLAVKPRLAIPQFSRKPRSTPLGPSMAMEPSRVWTASVAAKPTRLTTPLAARLDRTPIRIPALMPTVARRRLTGTTRACTALTTAIMRATTGGDKADGGENWIAGAIKHPGALHKALHVPKGEKIPEKKLAKAAHSENPTMRKRAALAKTLKGFH